MFTFIFLPMQVIDVVTSAWKRYRLRRLAVDRLRNSTLPPSHRGSNENRYTIDQDRLYTSLENGVACSDRKSRSSTKRSSGQQRSVLAPPSACHATIDKKKIESTLFRLASNGDPVCILVPDAGSGRESNICHKEIAPEADGLGSRTIANI
uniref:Uncharacterized protein n=1 Tax=Romanomermis culicivorax TaxID=13658 RepID=A0A915HN51_ROMCU